MHRIDNEPLGGLTTNYVLFRAKMSVCLVLS
jgi:hypothetical protein